MVLYISFRTEAWFSILGLIVLYWLNPWRLEQVELYNPGYIYLFSSLHLWSALKMERKSFWMTLIHCLVIGFCAQVHFSALILAILSSLLFLLKKIKVNWWGFSVSVILVFISLIPYWIQKHQMPISDVDLTKGDAFLGRNLILVYPVLKGIIYFFRMGSMYFGRHIFSEINFEWIINNNFLKEALSFVFHALKWLLAAGTLFFSFKIIGSFLWQTTQKLKTSYQKSEIQLVLQNMNIFDVYFYCLFLSAVISTALSPVEFNHWHLIVCFPAITIFILKYSRDFLTNKRLFVLGFIFVIWGLFLNLGSRSHSYKNDYAKDFFEHYKF